jgi:hypothetical protein
MIGLSVRNVLISEDQAICEECPDLKLSVRNSLISNDQTISVRNSLISNDQTICEEFSDL